MVRPKAPNPPHRVRFENALKSLGIDEIRQFRRADVTSELRQNTKLTTEDEHRLTACMELVRLGVTAEVAQALVLSDEIGGASEFISFESSEVERLLANTSVQRLLPAGFSVDRTMIEGWLERATPLTADADAPGREMAIESRAVALVHEEDDSLISDDAVVERERLVRIAAALRKSVGQALTTIEAIAQTKSPSLDDDSLSATLIQLRTEITGTIESFFSSGPDAFAAINEGAAPAMADESHQPSSDIYQLQAEQMRIEARIEMLRNVAAGASEASDPAAASEAGSCDHESVLREG